MVQVGNINTKKIQVCAYDYIDITGRIGVADAMTWALLKTYHKTD